MGIDFLISFKDGKRDKARLDLGTHIIGRSRSADLQIKDKLLSGRHMAIEISSGKILIKDLDSTNGTFLNGNKILLSNFHINDEIIIGTTRIKIDQDSLSSVDKKSLDSGTKIKFIKPPDKTNNKVPIQNDPTKSEQIDISFSFDIDDHESETGEADEDIIEENPSIKPTHVHSLEELTRANTEIEQESEIADKEDDSKQSSGVTYEENGSVVRDNTIDLGINAEELKEEASQISLESHTSKEEKNLEMNKRKKKVQEMKMNMEDNEEDDDSSGFFSKFFGKK